MAGKTRSRVSRGSDYFFLPLVESDHVLQIWKRQQILVTQQRHELTQVTIVARQQSTYQETPFTASIARLLRVLVIAHRSLFLRENLPPPARQNISKASTTTIGRKCIRGCTSRKMGKGCYAAYASVLTLATNVILLPFST